MAHKKENIDNEVNLLCWLPFAPPLHPCKPNKSNTKQSNMKRFFFLFGKWYVYRKELFPRISNINNLALET